MHCVDLESSESPPSPLYLLRFRAFIRLTEIFVRIGSGVRLSYGLRERELRAEKIAAAIPATIAMTIGKVKLCTYGFTAGLRSANAPLVFGTSQNPRSHDLG